VVVQHKNLRVTKQKLTGKSRVKGKAATQSSRKHVCARIAKLLSKGMPGCISTMIIARCSFGFQTKPTKEEERSIA
jgi:hypothetical protein